MPATLPETRDTPRLTGRLSRLLVRFRTLLLVREGSQVALLGIFLAGLWAFLDWRFSLSPLVRTAGLCGSLVAVTLVVFFQIVVPWRRERTPLAMARRVERRFPQCNDAIISAVQFLDEPDVGYGSRQLRAETVQFAEMIASEIDFREAASTRGLRRTLMLLFGAVVCVAWVFDHYPSMAQLALRRLAAPYGSDQWPPQTAVQVIRPVPSPYLAARLEPIEIVAVIRGILPAKAVLEIEEEDGRRYEQAHALSKSQPDAHETLLTVVLDPQRVERSFRFRVRANDGDSGWQSVEVHAPPKLVPRDGRPSPQVRLVYPAYMEREPVELLDGTTDIEVVTGTRVILRAAADRPLARAELVYRPEKRGWPTAVLASLTAPNGLNAATGVAMATEGFQPVLVQLSGERRLLDVDFIPSLPGPCVLVVRDDESFTAERVIQVRMETDPSPQVAMLQPTGSEPVPLVGNALFDLVGLAKDERFGLNDVWLEHRTRPGEPFRRWPIWNHALGRELLASLPYLLPTPPVGPPLPMKPLLGFPIVERMNLSAFRHSDGSALREGDVLELRIAANDRDDVTWNKPVGRSHVVRIEVVAPDRVDAVLQQGLNRMRQDLLFLHEWQRLSRLQLNEAMKESRQAGDLSPKLTQSEQSQEQVRLRWTAGDESVLARLDSLRAIARDNGLAGSATAKRLEWLSREMRRLQHDALEPIQPLWEKARAQSNLADPDKPAAQIERRQREIEESLRAIIDGLKPWSSAAEVRSEARLLLGNLKRAIAGIDQLQQRRPPELTGRDREKLSPEQREEIDRLATAGEEAAAQMNQLLDRLGRLIDSKETALSQAAPEEASGIRREIDALRRAAESLLSAKLGDLPAQVRRNQLADARARLADAVKQAMAAIESLADDDVPRLRKRPPDLAARLDKLIESQERLQNKVRDAEQAADRKAALQQLAAEQAAVERATEDLFRELTRQGDELAADVGRALRQMREQRERLEQGATGGDPDAVLDNLDEARENVGDQPKPEEDPLIRERQIQAADAVKALRDRQAAAIAEMKRLHAKALKQSHWEAAAARDSLPALAEQEETLAKEVRKTLGPKFDGEPVFAGLVELSAAALDSTARQLGEHREDVLDQLDGIAAFDRAREEGAARAILRWQELALVRLDQILEALKPAASAGQGGEGAAGGGIASEAGLPPLSQLKALRALQADIAERTRKFDAEHPGGMKLSDEDQAYLNALRRTQAEIVELLRKLSPVREDKSLMRAVHMWSVVAGPRGADPKVEDGNVRDFIERMMGDAKKAADLLGDKKPGEDARKLQENVLKDLDGLIRMAEQAADKNKKQSAEKKDGGRGSESAMRKERRQQQAASQTRPIQGQTSGLRTPPPPTGAAVMPKLPDAYKDVWGQLPEKVRQEMDQYFREQFMPRYSDLLRQYYSSLAEGGRSGP